MRRILIQYRVKPGLAEANEAAVGAVFEELRQKAPPGVRYACMKMNDGLSFAHLVELSGDANPIVELEAFKRFSAGVKDRADAPPVSRELEVVGDFGFFERP
jgi:hypothetical protein